MRIMLFAYEYPPLGGGVANAVQSLLQEWQKLPHDIVFVTSALDNRFSEEKLSSAITILRVPVGKRSPENYHKQTLLHMVRFTLGSILVGLNVLRKKRIDVSVAFGYPGPVASWVLSWLGIPYIVALRGVDVPGYNPRFSRGSRLHRLVCQVLWSRASVITTNSDWLAQLARKTLPTTRYHIIPNGVDTKQFAPVESAEKFSQFTVTAGGTVMGKKKRLSALISGFARFVKTKKLSPKQAQLLLIGDGDERAVLEHYAQRIGISSFVRFSGARSKKWISKVLPKCHVFCLPSVAEGMSNAALEALASGLPLLRTPVGAASSMVSQENGFLLQESAMEADIARYLELLYSHPQLHIDMGKRSRDLAMKYSWARVADSYLQLLQSTLPPGMRATLSQKS